MNCSEIRKKIPQWLDEELDASESAIIAEHVEACTTCRSEIDFWRELNAILKKDLGEITAPPGFADKVMAQIAHRPRTRMKRFLYSWKRSLAVAAAFLLVAVGSIGAYIQMGGNVAGHLAKNNESNTVQVNPKGQTGQSQPAHTVAQPGLSPGDTNTESGGKPAAPRPTDNRPGTETTVDPEIPIATGQEPAGNAVISENSSTQSDSTAQQEVTTPLTTGESPEKYALLNTAQDRVIERTLIRVKVENLIDAHNQALSYINNAGARYEVLGADNTADGGQETLKVIVNNAVAGKLQGELKTLGQVVTTDTQKDDLNSRYNEKVEQYRSLEAQMQAAQTVVERNQLEVKMAAVEAQLKTWAQEAGTGTIILWLES